MQQQFAVVSGKMTVEVNGQEYTLQQAKFWKVTTVSCANLFTEDTGTPPARPERAS